jgi:hypothetical protein
MQRSAEWLERTRGCVERRQGGVGVLLSKIEL